MTARNACVVASRRIGILAYILAFVLLSGCSRNGTATPPLSAKNVPIYPGANSVLSDTTEIGETRPAQSVNFQTRDKGEAVIGFYKDILLKDGWEINDFSTPEPTGLRFYWNAGCPTSAIDVIVEIVTDKQTKVEVVLRTFGCE